MAIAHEEFFDPQRAGGMAGADEHYIAHAVRNQFHSSQDEGAHQDLAQLAIRLHQRQHLLAA